MTAIVGKKKNTAISTALIAEINWPARTQIHAISRLVTSAQAGYRYLRLKLETM